MDMKTGMKPREIDTPKVLIADDDEATRILLRAALVQWGYHVVEAVNGEEAWKILQQPDPPRILILDWVMPKLDGVALCKRINQELSFHPYIIFLTRMASSENVIQGLEAGADEFLLKPFDLAELRIRIFAGQRIIKYRNQLEEQNVELQNYVANMQTLAREYAKQWIPFDDLAIILQGVYNTLKDVSEKLEEHHSDNEPALQKIEKLQGNLNNIIDMIKGYQVEPQKINQQPIPAVSTRKDSELIDMERMRAFFGENKQAIQDFIKTFVSLSSKQLQEIDTAIQNKDVKTGKYFFHLLGGASANSGITEMYDLCGKAEERIMEEDWKTVTECYQGLLELLDKLKSMKI